jgi:hypothetical protein
VTAHHHAKSLICIYGPIRCEPAGCALAAAEIDGQNGPVTDLIAQYTSGVPTSSERDSHYYFAMNVLSPTLIESYSLAYRQSALAGQLTPW